MKGHFTPLIITINRCSFCCRVLRYSLESTESRTSRLVDESLADKKQHSSSAKEVNVYTVPCCVQQLVGDSTAQIVNSNMKGLKTKSADYHE